jgi:RND family efflux transporter MFP subunit
MAKHAAGLLDVEREEERKSAASLAMAEKDLSDAVAVAPLSGRVTRRMAEPGETGSVGTQVLRIEDVCALDVSAFLPGQYYARVEPGATGVLVCAPGLSVESTVSYKSPTVDPSLRTFEIKCPLPGDGKCAVPGALVDAAVVLARREGLAVPVDAVQERAGRKVIFLADGLTARQIPVTTGLETGGFVEVSGDDLAAGSRVVTVGQFMLEDGTPIAAREEAR